jgi:VWFA-related protein
MFFQRIFRLLSDFKLYPLIFVLVAAFTVSAQRNSSKFSTNVNEVTILVTVTPDNDRTREIAARLQPSDFAVKEANRPQKIISVRRAVDEPVIFALLIQDDLVGRVNNELPELRDFIRKLPKDSRVMTAYVTSGSLQIDQPFTTDLERAAKSLHILRSSQFAASYSPYIQVQDAIKLFADQPKGRRMLLFVSDGLDLSGGFRWASALSSPYLDNAISSAQRVGVSIFTIYAPSVGLTSRNRRAMNIGQSLLSRISDETGGEAFYSGSDFVSFDPYIREYSQLLGNQWLVTYRSSNTKKGFRRIEVTTDFDIHLQHKEGYDAR